MSKKLIALVAFVVVLSVGQAFACYDNTDRLLVKLKKVDLTTEQLQDVFKYQKAHRDLIAASHEDGRGCSFHEHAEVDFEKASIGVLTDEQFEEFTGRARNEAESLRYENYLLKKELERMKLELAQLKAALEAAQEG